MVVKNFASFFLKRLFSQTLRQKSLNKFQIYLNVLIYLDILQYI